MTRLLVAPVLLLAAAAPAQTTAPVSVDARCIGLDGAPVEGVEFGDRWVATDGAWRPAFLCPDPQNPLRLASDADGRIAGTWTLSPMGTPLLGWSRDRSLVAIVPPEWTGTPPAARVSGTIAMQRAVRVRGAIRTTAPAAHHGLYVTWQVQEPWPNDEGFGFGMDRPDFEIALPPGRYALHAHAGRGAGLPRTLVLDPARDVVELGPISVTLPALDLIGEVLPDWNVTQARNVALVDASPAAFRGKPLLICFGDYGNPPRLSQQERDTLARLAAHPSRSSFHVVLFGPTHDFLAGLPERPPHPEFDRLFPKPKPPEPRVEAMFPLLSDDTGTTEARYGVLWGTALLDRDGHLLMHGDLAAVIAALERHLAASR